jgi:CHAD domain-containing protein
LYRENGDNGDNGDDGDDGAAARVAAVLARAFDLRPTPGCLQTEVAARLGLSGPATARAPHLLPQLGADLAGRAVLASALASLHAAEAGVRLGLDPEHVHKMRVATRRLRATLRLFSPCFPRSEADAAHRGLRWLSASLGRVRDLEVLLLGLEGIAGSLDCPPGGLDALRQLLSGRRSEARRRLAAALDSLRTQALGRRLKRLAAGPPPRRRGGHPAALPVALLARQALRRRWRQLRRAGRRALRSGLAEDVHCLRIAGKKMRYALEALRSLYPGGVDGLATRLVTLQDLLGRHQDQVTAATLLGELRDCLLRSPPDGEAARLPAATVLPFVLGQLHAAACLHAQVPVPGLRAAFRRACSERRGRELRRQVDSLARAMESTLRQPADPSSA